MLALRTCCSAYMQAARATTPRLSHCFLVISNSLSSSQGCVQPIQVPYRGHHTLFEPAISLRPSLLCSSHLSTSQPARLSVRSFCKGQASVLLQQPADTMTDDATHDVPPQPRRSPAASFGGREATASAPAAAPESSLDQSDTSDESKGLAARVTSIRNIRDFSEALPSIMPGRVIRCGKPSDASTSDVDHLLNHLGVRDLLDLRAMEEIEEDLPQSELFKRASRLISHRRSWYSGYITLPPLGGPPPKGPVLHHQISLLDRSRYYQMLLSHLPRATLWATTQRLMGNKDGSRETLLKEINGGGLPLLYRMLADAARPEILAALNLVTAALEQDRPVLLFCKAGKDRTGIMSALLLTCAGATREQILDDYTKSDKFHMMALAGIEKTEELKGISNAVFAHAPREAMASFLEHIHEQHGNLSAYMSNLGFTIDHQLKLRHLLTRQ